METRVTDEFADGRAVAVATEACRQSLSASVLADPLAFPEFEVAAWRRCAAGMPVEVDTFTRPKQGGGTRVEVVPDFATSLAFQLAADRVGGVSPRPYASWSETVQLWIRHALVEGMSVIVADVEDYFESLPGLAIDRALRRLDLDDGTVEATQRTIREINAVPDLRGTCRSGLPVSRDDLVWLVADAALRPVDESLACERTIARHVRWVDDFFIAADGSRVDQVLHVLSAALEAEGVRLNPRKTRVLDSLQDYERSTMTPQHRLITSLMMASARNRLSEAQRSAFNAFAESDRLANPQEARLWKRAYTLARRVGSYALVPAAIADLGRYPTATGQIASYLHSLNWPCDTAAKVVQPLARSSADSQTVLLLRALLGTAGPLPASAVAALKALPQSVVVALHPYAQVLLHACLVFRQRHRDGSAVSRLVSLARQGRSPLARRTAMELLWLIPEERRHLADLSREAASQAVRGLAVLPGIADAAGRERILEMHEPTLADRAWYGLGSALRSAWLQPVA